MSSPLEQVFLLSGAVYEARGAGLALLKASKLRDKESAERQASDAIAKAEWWADKFDELVENGTCTIT